MSETTLTKKYFDSALKAFSKRTDAKIDAVKRDLFDRMDSKFKAVDKRFDAIDKRFGGVERRLAVVETKLDAIVDELATRKELRNLVAELERQGVKIRTTRVFIT